MVCGKCSVEQPLSNKPCRSCGFDFSRPARSRHWEGGKGCRDRSLMSSKDAKKFTGKHKTVSRRLKSQGRPTAGASRD
jgi:ribosomal protein L40E